MKIVNFLTVNSNYLYKIIFAIVVFALPFYAKSHQNITDSIATLSYEQFEKYFEKYDIDTALDFRYACAYLQNARNDKDTLSMVNAFFQFSIRYTDDRSLCYADSIILYTTNKNYELYPDRAYLVKGNYFTLNGNFKNALENYFILNDIAKEKNNTFYQISAKFNIGIIKNKLGDTHEALGIFSECITFIETHHIPHQKQYLSAALLNLGEAFFFLGQYDSVELVVKRGVNLSLSTEDTYMYTNFLILTGANLYEQGKYKQAIDSLNKGKDSFNDEVNKMMANLYLGKTYYAMKDYSQAINYFTAIDSFLVDSGNIDLEILEAYPPLIEYYRIKRNIEKQLYYTNNLLKFDSIYDRIHNNSLSTINKKFSIPELIESKEELIKALQRKTHRFKRNSLISLIIGSLALFVTLYLFSRFRVYRNRFNKLINVKPEKLIEPIKSNKEKSEIDKAVILDILNKLEKFENSLKFLNKNLTLAMLSKALNTNSTYLSKIINEQKGYTFTNYITNLRLEYVIEKLKNDEKFRTFSIKAIAEEVGFKTAQPFSLAFKKKTGIYPSFFISQLQKQN